MAKFQVHIKGDIKTIKDLDYRLRRYKTTTNYNIHFTAQENAEDARRRAPVDTGELRDSIHEDISVYFQASIIASAPHALFVEYGTRRMAAQPYMYPSSVRYFRVLMKRLKEIEF